MKWLALLSALFIGGEAYAAACTDGTDCYCDCVNGPADPGTTGGLYFNSSCEAKVVPVDADALMCEDFEAITLTAGYGTGSQGQTGAGVGSADDCVEGNPTANCYGNTSAPLYGPDYDSTGGGFSGGNRGANGYWNKTYGASTTACIILENYPPAPTLGTTCDLTPPGGSQGCTGASVWTSTSANNADLLNTCLAFPQAGEFNDERASLSDPIHPAGGSGPFDGATSLAQRQPTSDLNTRGTGGFHGGINFDHEVDHIGITQALAFPADIIGSNIFESPLKINEQGWNGGGNFENLDIGNTSCGAECDEAQILPYSPFAFGSGVGGAACTAALNAADLNVGDAFCTDSGVLRVFPVAAEYVQAVDFPYGTWGCARAEQVNKGQAGMEWRIWHNDELIFELENFDGTVLLMDHFSNYKFNNHSNHNQFVGQTTAYTTFRYFDNIHVREGTPVTCAQIGIGTITPPEETAGELNLSASAYSIDEDTINLTVTVARTVGTAGAVGATISTSATGVAGAYTDFLPDPQTVSWADGVGSTDTVNIVITADALDEDAETFTVSLGSPTGGATIGSTSTAVVTINDDDATPSLSIDDVTRSEASTTATHSVRLSSASGRTVTVNVASSNSTATAPYDYTAFPSTVVTLNEGQVSESVTVTLIPDIFDENNETYTMTLSGASNATIADATATGTITDNDSPPTVTLLMTPGTMDEAAGVSILAAQLSAPSGLDVTTAIDFATSNATVTTDYTRSGTSIVILGAVTGGPTSGTLTLTAVQDVTVDPGEFIRAVIDSVTNGTAGTPASVDSLIMDDDTEPPPVGPGINTPVILSN